MVYHAFISYVVPYVKYEKKGTTIMRIDNKKLSVLMADRGLYLKDLCKMADISEICFRNIRQGKSIPKPATVGKIARALNVNVQEIIAEE